MTKCIATPLGRRDLRKMAIIVRIMEECVEELYFDIVHFLDITLPKLDPDFSFNVKPIEEMGECHGLTFPDRKEIQIREDVYNRACEGSGRDRMTMAHELFHLLQHEKSNISYARTENGNIPLYRDPEWQAEAFGGELLVPHHLIHGMEVEDIIKKCGVSSKAAKCQLVKY